MSLVFKHAIRHGLIVGGEGSNPLATVRCRTSSDFESMVIEPCQAFAIWERLAVPERLLLLLCATTGSRVSEGLGLQWADVEWARDRIHIRCAWTGGKIGPTKTKASRSTVPMDPLLAEYFRAWRVETTYEKEIDWVFASFKLKGKQPLVGNMVVGDHLRPAAVAAGVLKAGDKTRFGFHTLRHSLASYLVTAGTDPKTIKMMLRHADVSVTLGLYAHGNTTAKMAAQGVVLDAFFGVEKAP
jgi:integrase